MTEQPKKRMSHNYIDNKKFQEAMTIFIRECRVEAAAGRQRPKIPDYIGKCIYDIAINLAKKYNFANYSYIDEMVSDGIENCITYIDRFDPDNPRANAFSYFTQTMWFAFLRRIDKEKKQGYIKDKYLANLVMMDQGEAADSDFFLGSQKTLEEYHVYENIAAFEEGKEKKNKRRKAKPAKE